MTSKFNPSLIVSYIGRVGSGKTLTMVKDAINYYHTGLPIFTNMDSLNFPHIKIKDSEVYDISRNEKFRDCVFMVDEFQTIVNSRRSMDNRNIEFMYFIQQIRKRNIKFLYTTQISKRVDVSVREHIDIEVRPRMVSVKGFEDVLCQAEYIDLYEQEEKGFYIPRVSVFVANQVFPYYNTKEEIKPMKKEDKEDKE